MSIAAILVAAIVGAYVMFTPKKNSAAPMPMPEEIVQRNEAASGEAEIYLAGGCFWGTEFFLRNVAGVISTEVGYANGNTRNPTYREVCNDSGHAEAVHVIYDAEKISLTKLLAEYSRTINPTLLNRQGNDRGIQYRTGIYFSNPADAATVDEFLRGLQENYSEPVVVEHASIKNFYRAEDEHQDYLTKNPNGYCHVPRSLIDEQRKLKAAETLGGDFPRDKVYGKPTAQTLENLSDLQRAVTQDAATEPPFRNEYDAEFRKGIYVDVTTGQPLFVSTDKFDSGCGWPAFAKPIDKSLLDERADNSFGMRRIEVRAKASGAHLGHVFDDGPKKLGGIRYCINSASLRFVPRDEMTAQGYGDWLDLFND